MYKILRTQVNLRFTNEDVFNNLVEPLKASRELSGLIVKLLTLYYSNKETRNLVRGMLLDDILSMKDNDGVSDSVVSGMDMSLKDKAFERKPEDIQLEARVNSIESTLNKVLSILESNKDSTTSESDIVSNIPLENSSLNKPYQPPIIEKIPEVEDVAITNQEMSQVSIIEKVLKAEDEVATQEEDLNASEALLDVLNDLIAM